MNVIGIIAVTFVALFLTIVVPLWLILHYSTRWRQGRGLGRADRERFESLWLSARKLRQRMNEIEAILDGDSPNWRRDDD